MAEQVYTIRDCQHCISGVASRKDLDAEKQSSPTGDSVAMFRGIFWSSHCVCACADVIGS